MKTEAYINAKQLLHSVCTEKGFLASKSDVSNYKRIWARDGVICGLAALLDGDKKLVDTFKNTLITLSENQHPIGNIPSNVWFDKEKVQVSFGGLCGRVDTISWYVIGVCNYVWFTKDFEFLKTQIPPIKKGLTLLEAWEFNNKNLIYTPTSGNWADEYPIEGYTLYDNCLRLWALQSYQKLKASKKRHAKIKAIKQSISINFTHTKTCEKQYHAKALNLAEIKPYWLASFSPKAYNTRFDAFGNALALLLNIENEPLQKALLKHAKSLQKTLTLGLLPAFWPPILSGECEWKNLETNNAYEFRNFPFEFHNGGTWAIVNGFFGLGLVRANKKEQATQFLFKINKLNKQNKNNELEWGFFENFNTQTAKPIGVKTCAWSAAATILLTKYLDGKFLLIG